MATSTTDSVLSNFTVPISSTGATPTFSESPTTLGNASTTFRPSPTATSDNGLTLLSPSTINYCEQVAVTWTGGVAPYTIKAEASSSVTPDGWSQTVDQTLFQFFNTEVLPGNEIKIYLQDNQATAIEKIFTVAGDASACTAITTTGAWPSTSLGALISDNQYGTGALSSGIIVGIVIAASAFLLVVGMAIWFYRRWTASRPKRVIPYNLEHKNAGDRTSIISGRSSRSARSLWSTFSGRVGQPTPSVEDGVRVEIDTVQVIEEARSPMGAPPPVPMFTSRRTTREWTGYPLKPQGGSRRVHDIPESFGPSTVMTPSETSSNGEHSGPPRRSPNTSHPTAEQAISPFADANVVYISDSKTDLGRGDENNVPSEADAAQLSRETLEALADIVAARLHQRSETAPVSNTRTSKNGSELPPRYF